MANIAEQWRGSGGIGAKQREALASALSVYQNAYLAGPWLMSPDAVKEQLSGLLEEVDPWMVYNVLDTQAWEVIGGYTGDYGAERNRAVQESRRQYKYNPLHQWAVWLWTSWGIGDKVRVTVVQTGDDGEPVDNDEKDATNPDWVVNDLFTSDRNEVLFADDRIDDLSNFLLVDGNRFFLHFISTQDGEDTVRKASQDEMTPVCNPEDASDVWFYKRQWTPTGKTQRTVYYPDYHTLFAKQADGAYDEGTADRRWALLVKAGAIDGGAQRADKPQAPQQGANGQTTIATADATEKPPPTVACVQWVRHNVKNEDELWGWPLATCARPWLTAQKEYMESRLTLAKAASQYVRRKKVKGGSRAVNSVIGQIGTTLSQSNWSDTNPPAVAGSVEVDNDAIETTDLPLVTGARDTADDNKTFSWMALLGDGLLTTSAGLDTARFATALEMDKAQSSLFENYRTFWGAQFRKAATIALMARERYGGQNYGEYTITVSIDSFSLADFPAIVKTIGQLVRDTVAPFVDNGTMDPKLAMSVIGELWRVSLSALGIERAHELTTPEALGIAEPEGEEEELPELPPEEPEDEEPSEMPPGMESDVLRRVAQTVMENAVRQAEWAIGAAVDEMAAG
jgi:hypothetical protein